MDAPDKPRRDFLFIATGAVAAIGAAALTLPLLGHMAPAGDSDVNLGMDIDLSKLEEGMEMRVIYLGRPVAFATERPPKLKWHKREIRQNYLIRKQTGQG